MLIFSCLKGRFAILNVLVNTLSQKRFFGYAQGTKKSGGRGGVKFKLTESGETAKNILFRAISSAWIERWPPEPKVKGSNPLSPLNNIKWLCNKLNPLNFLLLPYINFVANRNFAATSADLN
jgi:hypothetical protein